MTSRRPDPDELLERVRAVEEEAARGKLTIFFGAAPGVGKTYTMLEAARTEVSDGHRDVVIGVVETHGRYDTGSLIIGLELLPRRVYEHRAIKLEELDLDGALRRKPGLILVDELAHTNAPGGRHTKRWQDVEELLNAGIDVFTTLNVQHLESLNDVVAQITGVVVRETVPDSVFDKAYEVRVVDLPVDELLERLREGKVYVPAQAAHAVQNFFKEGNLIALRELALRRTAERVEAKMRVYKAVHGIDESWHTGERVLVCVSPSPSSARLIRAARRMATSLHAELLGLYVETPASIRMSNADRERLAQHMRLVESLDGEPITVRAENAALETVQYARKRNVTKIVVGKPTHPRWRDIIRPSFLDDIVRHSPEIDVYVISGLREDRATKAAGALGRVAGSEEREPLAAGDAGEPRHGRLAPFAYGAMVVTTATAISWVSFGRTELADIVMIHLLGVVIVAMRFGYAPSIFAAVLSVLAVDFVFVPPYLSFAVSDLRHLATFAVMFVVAVVISHLTRRIREQADSARRRERRTAGLYAISRGLGLAKSREELLETAARHLREALGANIAIFLGSREEGSLAAAIPEVAFADPDTVSQEKDGGVIEWVWNNQRPAGIGTDTLPSSRALVVPLKGSKGRVGVLAIYPTTSSAAFSSNAAAPGEDHASLRLGDPDDRQLLETLTGLVGSAIERTQLAEEARRARLRAETEHLRNALLSSVSHDLRTPLGVITGATSALLEDGPASEGRAGVTDETMRRELLQTAHDEAQRLTRLVRNLLDMTRLEAGALKIKKVPESVEEIVGSALARTADRLRGRDVELDVPSDLVVPCDPALIEQVLINLLENATKYSPPKSPIAIRAKRQRAAPMAGSPPKPDQVEIAVSDRGPGVAAKDRERIFDKFYRANEGEGGGVGLGLTICRGIISAHGGTIEVDAADPAREASGATFRIRLPLSNPNAAGDRP